MTTEFLSSSRLFIALAIVTSMYIFATTLEKVVPTNQIVKVRGVAEREITSDRVDWSLSISYSNKELEKAYQQVDKASEFLVEYLVKHGIDKTKISFSNYYQDQLTETLVLDKFGNTDTKFIGFDVRKTLTINAFPDIDLVDKLAKSIGNDIQRQGWNVSSESPYYYYSKKISDIKPELLKQSAQNAFERATIIAESSGSKLGNLKAARQGVFEGFNEDGHVGGYSRKHRVSAVVTVDFSIKR